MPTTIGPLTLDANGQASASFTPEKPGKLVFIPGGAPALIGVYEGSQPDGNRGKLRIEPGAKKGVRELHGIPHLVTFKGTPGATVSVLVRPWSFWDIFG